MQCFTVSSNEIEGRLDPYYVKSISNIRNIKTNYPVVKLNSLLKEPPQYGANEAATNGNPKTDVRYVRITDIDEFGNLKNDVWKTATYVDEKYLLNDKDILFARSGATAGKTFIYDENIGKAIFAGYLIRFRIDETKANPSFVFYYTQLKRYSDWLKLIQRPSGQPNINAEEFKSFEIPLPPLSIQNQIVNIMQSAYEQKKQKEAETHRLLDPIDGYMLDELGIKLPEVEEKMCFVVSSEEVQENRVDAFYYQPRFVKLTEAMRKSPFEIKTLGNLSIKIINGFDFREFTETGIPYLRVSNIKPNSFDTSDVKCIPAFSISKDIELENGDLLITRKGTYGNSVIIDDEHKRMVISSEIFRVVLKKDNVNPHYVAIWLNNNIAKQLFNRISTGGIMGHLSQDALKNIQIILPSLEIQTKIADEVKRRMSESERLKAEAGKIIEEAKKKVEKMILGDK